MLKTFSNIRFKLILILIFTLIFYSCETVKTTYIDKENMPTEKDREFQEAVPKISGVFLKSGKYLDMREKNAVINFTANPKTITYNVSDTEKASIAFDDISTFKVSLVKGNIWFPILLIAGIAAFLFIGLIVAFSKGHFNATGG